MMPISVMADLHGREEASRIGRQGEALLAPLFPCEAIARKRGLAREIRRKARERKEAVQKNEAQDDEEVGHGVCG